MLALQTAKEQEHCNEQNYAASKKGEEPERENCEQTAHYSTGYEREGRETSGGQRTAQRDGRNEYA